MKNVIHEATTEEIGHLDDVLEIPKSELPFHNIFGDRYRILGSFKSDSPTSPFNLFESFVKRTGWALLEDDISQAVKHIKAGFIGTPSDGIQLRTKETKISLVKYFQDLVRYLDGIPEIMKRYSKLVEELRTYSKEKFGGNGRGFKKEFFEDKQFLNMSREKLSLEGAIQKFVPDRNSSYMNMYSSMSKIRWDGDYLKEVDDFFKISNLKKQALNMQKWLVGEKGTGEKNYVKFSGVSYSEYKETLVETEYVVFSRHPIDVFRMSDHEGLASCHTLPSSRDKLGASPSEEKWDQYNICAMAEAHANGMIAYALNPNELEEPPTQDTIDQYEDGELFTDDERGIDGFQPVARLRIKNVAFLAEKGDYSEVLSRIAVPEDRTYGDEIPGFAEYVNKTIASAQESKIEDIIENSGDVIDLRRFLRVGGSYQDNRVESNLFNIFKLASGKELEFEQSVQYSHALEQSLKDTYEGTSMESAQSTLDSLISDYGTGYLNFDNLSVEEDWDGQGFYMSGDVAIIWRYEKEIYSFENAGDVRRAIEEALDQAKEIYFYDDGWFEDPTVMFDGFLAGSSNTMIIRFPITQFNAEHNEEYIPYVPDTWLYAFSEIKDKINYIMDPHVSDSLNNYIKHYISFHYPSDVITDVSGEYAVSKLKSTLEEDGNWEIEDEQEDDDSPLGDGTTIFFTAKVEAGADLGSTFANLTMEDYDEDNPDQVERAKKMSGALATIISVLQSEGMSALKASLLNDAFIANPDLYDSLSSVTTLGKLDMKVEAEIGRGGEDISPDRIYKGIAEDDELTLVIYVSVSQSDWEAVDSEVIGKMMIGEFKDNNGWHIDADEVLEKMIGSDLVRLTQRKPEKDLKEFIRKQTRLLLRSR
tara:strand:- start:1279 stop:3894 length:2616 start_codon:yes stop_codon:yes gene_type:complete